jgi:hypothetical protein
MPLHLVMWAAIFLMPADSPRLAFVERRRRWLGRRSGSRYVSCLRFRRRSGPSRWLLGGCSGGRGLPRGSFAKRCGRLAAHLASEAELAAVAATTFFLHPSFLMPKRRPCREDGSFRSPPCPVVQILGLESVQKGSGRWHGGTFSKGN